jgi:tetratricopeptide (TPR) repeat protein
LPLFETIKNIAILILVEISIVSNGILFVFISYTLINYFLIKTREKMYPIIEDKADPARRAIEYFNRGNLERLLQNYEVAISYYNKAIELDPKFAEAFYKRGNIKYIMENYDSAMQDYDEAIKLNPKLAEAYHNRGLIKYNKGDLANGRIDFTIAAQLGCFKSYDVKKGYCN